MSNCAIIAEYNPFHNGHKLHIDKTRELTGCENIVVIMSGNFVQRGEASICDKYLRTNMALLCGADVVIENPVAFSSASAGYFAESAVDLANSTNIIDRLSFGSEIGDVSKLSSFIINEDDQNSLNKLSQGLSYPSAFSNVNTPNDILALEYLKNLKRLSSGIEPFTIRREGGGYNEWSLTGEMSSATAIRRAAKERGEICSVPAEVYKLMHEAKQKNELMLTDEKYFQALRYMIMSMTKLELSEIHDVAEGLENRIISAASCAKNLEDLVMAIKSKRYTYTRIKRVLLNVFLGLSKQMFAQFRKDDAKYIRVLGFRREKQAFVGELVNKSSRPVITNLKAAKELIFGDAMKMLEFEIRSTDLYNVLLDVNRPKNYELSQPLVIL